MRFQFVLFLLLGCVGAAAEASDRTEFSARRLCPATLVRARVRDVTVARGLTTATLEVIHVYSGPASAKGATFVVCGATSGQSNNGTPSMFPPYEPGELQIWMLQPDKRRSGEWVADPVTSHLIGGGLGYLWIPSRERDPSTRFSEMIAWADAVQKTVEAPIAQRRSLLEGFAKSDVAPTRQWARDLLGIHDTTRPTTRPAAG